MGQITLPSCDKYGTIQRKGLRTLMIGVWEMSAPIPAGGNPKWEASQGTPLFTKTLAVGERGKKRVLELIEAACQPVQKRKPKAEGKPGDEG